MSAVLLGIGASFFFAGTVGVLRFPDTLCRLHALTKADNLGLGFVVAGLVLRADAPGTAELFLIWTLSLLASGTSCYLIARRTLEERTDARRSL